MAEHIGDKIPVVCPHCGLPARPPAQAWWGNDDCSGVTLLFPDGCTQSFQGDLSDHEITLTNWLSSWCKAMNRGDKEQEAPHPLDLGDAVEAAHKENVSPRPEWVAEQPWKYSLDRR